FFDRDISTYTDTRPFFNPPTLMAEDELAIKKKAPGWHVLQKRLDAFNALQQIGNALHNNRIQRFGFLVCSAGASTTFMNRLAVQFRAEVACFTHLTAAYNDGQKATLILARDQGLDPQRFPSSSDQPLARVAGPALWDPSIAYIATPPPAPPTP